MNFTRGIKRELLKEIPEKECCRRAFLCGVLDACGERSARGFSFTSESEEIAEGLFPLVEGLYGVPLTLTETAFDHGHGRDKLTFRCTARAEADIGEDCCAVSYLRGAFLGGGSCTLPKEGKKTGYHLEIGFERGEDADRALALLDRLQIIGSTLPRGERRIVYLKSREAIADLLFVLGARGALGTLEEISAQREERNGENRRENCYAGNADKAAIASAAQVVAIGKLAECGGLSPLSDALKETARARLARPELSLSELAQLLGIGKSCLNHRLRKLMELSRGK